MMLIAVLVMAGLLALALIVLGFLIEAHSAAYKPASEPFGIDVESLDPLDFEAEPSRVASPYAARHVALPVIQLDAPSVLGALFWLAFLIPLVDHLMGLQGSWTAFIVWALTIGPHEMGHLLFMPFGELMMFLGGSVWQVLPFVLLGLWGIFVRNDKAGALLMFMLTGHSLLNLSVYIADAQERDLDLILGMDPSHHDWWNILQMVGLLEHDDTIAMTVRVLGVLIILATTVGGVWNALRWRPTRYAKQEDFPKII